MLEKVNKRVGWNPFQTKMSTQSGGLPHRPPDQQHHPQQHIPGQVSNTPAWAGNGALGGATENNRTFSQIIEEEKLNRNILEITLSRQNTEEVSQNNYQRRLTFDDIGDLIFDIIKIDPKDCLAFDYNTGRNDLKHIKLKPGVNVDQFVTGLGSIFLFDWFGINLFCLLFCGKRNDKILGELRKCGEKRKDS